MTWYVFDMDFLWCYIPIKNEFHMICFYILISTEFSNEFCDCDLQESLRAWLRKFVSKDIFTWQDLTDEAVYQAHQKIPTMVNFNKKLLNMTIYSEVSH